jgi:GntR family transcriptional repressor for pyruvate dehydrogenase complex
MNYRAIKRNSAPELVMQEILNSIVSGELKPGDRLPPERELTKMFDVGRSTVREATSALALMGCLEMLPGRGTFLKEDFQPTSPFSMKLSDIQAAANICDLIEIREILEFNAVKLAARRADANHIRRIKENLAKMKEAVRNVQEFSEYDFDFHISIARATGNEMIYEMMTWIVQKVHKEYEKFRPKALFQLDEAVMTAEQIVTSVIKGEEEEAARFMHDHLNLIATELKRMMPDMKWSRRL